VHLFHTQFDVFDSDEDVGGDLFEDGDDGENELVETNVESRQLGFVVTPQASCWLRVLLANVNFQTVCMCVRSTICLVHDLVKITNFVCSRISPCWCLLCAGRNYVGFKSRAIVS
jgi:hypothetical protein